MLAEEQPQHTATPLLLLYTATPLHRCCTGKAAGFFSSAPLRSTRGLIPKQQRCCCVPGTDAVLLLLYLQAGTQVGQVRNKPATRNNSWREENKLKPKINAPAAGEIRQHNTTPQVGWDPHSGSIRVSSSIYTVFEVLLIPGT